MQHSTPVERRIAAIMATDVVAYSRLIAADEEGTLARLGALRGGTIDTAVARHHGRIVKSTGDGLLIEFASIVEAVRCAVEIQDGVAHFNRDETADRQMLLRIGVNLGDVVVQGDDIFGDGVNIAARLEQMANPGTICLSQAACDHLGGRLSLPLEDLGERQFKNMARPVRVFRIGTGHGQPPAAPVVATPAARHWGLPAAASVALVVLLAGGAWWLWDDYGLNRNPTTVSPQSTQSSLAAVRLRAAGRTPIAVLPFANLGGDPKEEYFSDGLTEEITDGLGRYSRLSVIAHSAVAAFKAKAESPDTIARTLGVRYLVTGSVRRADKRVRVLVRLSNAEEGRLVWTQQFDEALDDVLAMRDQITRRIVTALEIRLTRAEQERIGKKATENLEAYDLVLRGRALLADAGRRANVEAREMLQRAINADSRYSDAYVELGRSYRIAVDQGWAMNPHETLGRAETAARKALELDDTNSRAYALLGRIMVMRQQFDLAKSAAGRALQLNPSDPEGYYSLGTVLLYSGEIDQAIEALETARAYTTSARDEYSAFSLALAYYVAGRYSDCVQFVEGVLGRDAGHNFTYFVLAMAFAQLGNVEEARAVAAIARKQNPVFDASVFGSLLRNATHQARVREGLRKAGIE